MKLDALDHPKTLDFAARLEVELPTAIGYLELLWAFTAKKAPQGNIGKWPDGAVARACYWMGSPETFLTALRESGFLDADSTHRYLIHDWPEHAPRWVKSKLKTLGLSFVGDISPDTEGDNEDGDGADTCGDTSPPTKGRVGKGSEAKPSEGKRSDNGAQPRAQEIPPSLDMQAWDRWLDYRKQVRKPLKSASIPAAQKALAAFGCEQAAVVEQSIANGWQGLFPLKTKPSGRAPLATHNSEVARRWAKGGGHA